MLQEAILATPPDGTPGRYRPDDQLLAFLKSVSRRGNYAEHEREESVAEPVQNSPLAIQPTSLGIVQESA